jgi:hypothetical protein
MRLYKKPETQTYLVFLLEHWESVRKPNYYLCLFADQFVFSFLPSADFTDSETVGSGSEKKLHHQCGKAQPLETCQLP